MEVTRRIAAGHLDGSDQRAAAGDEKRSAGGIGGDVARCDLAGREGDRDEVDGVRFVRMTRTAGDRSRHRRSERLSGSFLPTPQSHVCTCASSRCYACSLLTCLRNLSNNLRPSGPTRSSRLVHNFIWRQRPIVPHEKGPALRGGAQLPLEALCTRTYPIPAQSASSLAQVRAPGEFPVLHYARRRPVTAL
jgi:hypothetical protein